MTPAAGPGRIRAQGTAASINHHRSNHPINRG